MNFNYVTDAAAIPGISVFEIPLTNIPQTFAITLAGVDYLLTVRWNDASDGGWVMDIANNTTNAVLACNIPFIVGADLLEGLEYLGINGQFFVYTSGNQTDPPTLDNLGADSNLYFTTSDPNG